MTITLRKTNRKLKDTQQQLEKHQQELVDTVHARTSDLVVMRDQALAASEAKSFFLSKVSHELRTPLNAIIGYTEIIYDETNDEFTLTWTSFIQDILWSTLKMSTRFEYQHYTC